MEKKNWFIGASRNDMMIPTTPVCRKTKTGATMIIGAFDNRRDAIMAAAAPELLESLKMLVNVCTHPQSTKAEMRLIANEARAAISKAKGSQ